MSCTISRNGDLVGQSFIQLTMRKFAAADATTGLPFYPAEDVVDDVSLEIGGQPIDKVYADWYRMYDELFRSNDAKKAYKDLTNWDSDSPTLHVKTFYLPLLFFFCQVSNWQLTDYQPNFMRVCSSCTDIFRCTFPLSQSPGLALPLIGKFAGSPGNLRAVLRSRSCPPETNNLPPSPTRLPMLQPSSTTVSLLHYYYCLLRAFLVIP